jgi:hypothetical protein
MKKLFLGVVAALLLVGPAFSAEPEVKVPVAKAKVADVPELKVPTEMKVKPGRLLRIPAETACKTVIWYLDSADADLVTFESTKEAVFSSPVPGKYKIIVYTAAGDVPSQPYVCVVTVEGDVPVPPTPPTPPGPGPDPIPVDVLLQNLVKAYQADTTADKATKLQALVTLWKSAAKNTVNDADIKTTGKLLEVLHNSAQQLLGNDLMGLREAIRVDLDSKLPKTATAALDDATRKAIAVHFQNVADALGKVK